MEGSLGLKYTALERSATETLEDGSATETPNGNIPEILEEGATESEEHSSQTQKNVTYNSLPLHSDCLLHAANTMLHHVLTIVLLSDLPQCHELRVSLG